MRHVLACMLLCLPAICAAADLRVLSAGAVEPGLRGAVAAFEQGTGHRVQITFNTAPQLRKRLDAACGDAEGCVGERWDAVIAPPALLAEFARTGKLQDGGRSVGKVGLGVVVRTEGRIPELTPLESFERALLNASAVVFNRASTGIHFEGWLRKAGLYERLEARTVRFDDGASVMERLIRGTGEEIGVGAITEIMLYRDRGLRFVGPVPTEVQNFTTYAVTGTTASRSDAARSLVEFLSGERAREIFRAAGIE